MSGTIKKLITVFCLQWAAFELILQLEVWLHWRESTAELALLIYYVLLTYGLGWALWLAFARKRLRFVWHGLAGILLFAGIHTFIYFYSWYVRPNIGLYREPEWVSRFPEFQKQQRERIEANKWKFLKKSREPRSTNPQNQN